MSSIMQKLKHSWMDTLTLHVHNSGNHVFHEHIYKSVAYACSGTHDTQEACGSSSLDELVESWQI